MKLYEDQNQEDEQKEEEQEQIIQQSINGDGQVAEEVPLSDDKFVPVEDGNIPQNSQGITSGQYDALNGTGFENISFEQGNFNQVMGYPQLVSDKVASLTRTLVPLIEVALIELLGNNQNYKRQSGQCAMSFQNNQLALSFSFIYVVNGWIGTDIAMEDIQHDSNYVLNRIRPVGANITKCEIDTESGTLTIMGTM
jgi:hypothetical protein